MGLSIRAYAQHRGVSHTAVAKAIKAGRISKEPDGSIDPAKADAQWARNTLASQNLNTSASKPGASTTRHMAHQKCSVPIQYQGNSVHDKKVIKAGNSSPEA